MRIGAASVDGTPCCGVRAGRLVLALGLLLAALLDEPTSRIDPITEARIYEGSLAALTDACISRRSIASTCSTEARDRCRSVR
jgi:hypothetical protein